MRSRKAITLQTGILLAAIVLAPTRGTAAVEPTGVAIEHATRIVRARAVADSSFVLAGTPKSAPREIRTDWTLEIMEIWKGLFERGVPIKVRIKGGKVGDLSMRVEGEPEVIRGGEYVFFLVPDSTKGLWRSSSVGWGCLPIVRSMVTMPREGEPLKVTVPRLRRDVQKLIEPAAGSPDSLQVGR